MAADRRLADPEALLARVPLFSGLNPKEIRQLAELCLPKAFPAGAKIIDEGKPGLGLFIITSGRVEVYRGQGEAKRTVVTHGAGTIIGEISLVDNQPRAASVVTLDPTECLLVTRDSFRTLVERHPAIAWRIVPVIAQRFRRAEQQLLEIMDAADAAEPDATDREPRQDETREEETQEAQKESAKPPKPASSEQVLDLLRAEYALAVSGAEGLGHSARIMETFFRALARETELERDQELDRLFKQLPKALKEALSDALREGEQLPERMLATFRRELHRR